MPFFLSVERSETQPQNCHNFELISANQSLVVADSSLVVTDWLLLVPNGWLKRRNAGVVDSCEAGP